MFHKHILKNLRQLHLSAHSLWYLHHKNLLCSKFSDATFAGQIKGLKKYIYFNSFLKINDLCLIFFLTLNWSGNVGYPRSVSCRGQLFAKCAGLCPGQLTYEPEGPFPVWPAATATSPPQLLHTTVVCVSLYPGSVYLRSNRFLNETRNMF